MRKSKTALLGIVFMLLLTACAAAPNSPSDAAETEKTAVQQEQQFSTESVTDAKDKTENNTDEHEEPEKGDDMITLTVGGQSFDAVLEDNSSAQKLKELLENGSIAMSASNYGGFEKVCSLGTRITSEDVQTTTQAGDIMLYNGSQIVIFYGSNSWAYTRLAKVVNEDIPNLKEILSGNENEVVIEIAKS